MNQKQWEIFCNFKEEFKSKVQEWVKLAPELKDLQRDAALEAGTPEYPFENTLVYNLDLDKITPLDDIRLIVIGDNPGKDEQLEKNNRYLVGLAGKIADGYFKRNPQLCVDFRKNVIILNKTPIHSAKTIQLKKIIKKGGDKIKNLVEESQIWMAKKTAALHIDLCKAADSSLQNSLAPEIWLVGYSELKQRGIFTLYRDELKKAYQNDLEFWKMVYVFQHFSMNCFTKDLDNYCKKNGEDSGNLLETLHHLGSIHKEEIFI